MACPEIDQMRREVCGSLRGSVNTWQYQLQAKWGDPAVYEAECKERLKQDVRIVYDADRRTTALLNEAYAKKAMAQRDNHDKRMTELKSRNYRNAGKRLQSRATLEPRTA